MTLETMERSLEATPFIQKSAHLILISVALKGVAAFRRTIGAEASKWGRIYGSGHNSQLSLP